MGTKCGACVRVFGRTTLMSQYEPFSGDAEIYVLLYSRERERGKSLRHDDDDNVVTF